MCAYEKTSLWQSAFSPKNDGFEAQRNKLVEAYRDFRQQVALLLQRIQCELPDLTLHDITHVDALWDVASQIAGTDYPLNPSEAFVLGGAFLLHDAAHCRAAFGGLDELKKTTEWQDAAALRGLDPTALVDGSYDFQAVIFDTLRQLHPKQARELPFANWASGTENIPPCFLLPHRDLREAYGHVIGEIAESHWWHPHELESFARQLVTAPVCLAPASWTVDRLKLAVLLRTADAAHIDARRAPRLLMELNNLEGTSKDHWKFQARLHQPYCDAKRNELVFSASPFPENEYMAWWLAFDAATLASKELASADLLLRDNGLSRLTAHAVVGAYAPTAFAQYVPTSGWHPVDTNLKLTDIKSVVERFGGEKLYGKDPASAVRELLQNAADAIRACRCLDGLSSNEGEIEVALDADQDSYCWLHITDTGIGMSRYVLTQVLLDFGRSLWRSGDLRGEWSGLAASGFEAVGQFGIGFFSVFMLGEHVRVVSRRYEAKEGECPQWLLEFTAGTNKRPILREPKSHEGLKRHGTRVSVRMSHEKLALLCPKLLPAKNTATLPLWMRCAQLAPALDINLVVRTEEKKQQCVVANDWLALPQDELMFRLFPHLPQSQKKVIGTHLSEIKNQKGQVIGRCTIRSQPTAPLASIGSNTGICVVNGLLAGSVTGIVGVIHSRPQSDIARKAAIPDVSLPELQHWAELQKASLLENSQLDMTNSALLAYFGASYAGLILGKIGGEYVTYEDLIEWLQTMTEIIVHEGDVDYDDYYDSDIPRNEFNDFVPNEYLLEVASIRMPDWLDEITEDSNVRKSWSLTAALDAAFEEAWGKIDEDNFSVVVGEINSRAIERECRVVHRHEFDD